MVVSLFILAIGVAGWLAFPNPEHYLGSLLYTFMPEKLNLAQAVVERYLSPTMWDFLFRFVLAVPLGRVVVYIGVMWLLFSSVRRRRRRRA